MLLTWADAATSAGTAVGVILLALLVIAVLRSIGRSSVREGMAPAPGMPMRQCPDCAETVLAEARVCKHCGHRFADTPSEAQE